ncbi:MULTISPECIES: glutathione S-transferase family protein [unclassified Bradyrhizobium]|uniref:glutathione S-transferase family protein n=1 Tax=unclassified Bradyrhizobium TaxID=2631580 RepID=UPI0028E3626D|nr:MULTISPECIES: glutathione S-transferase family protein [unclassified Bradyrhizobium]
MKIYGDRISGNCLKVKWVCDLLALPYDWIDIDVVKGETRTSGFLALNPWGQVPTVVLADARILTQSNAIIRYLARDSVLIPADPFSAAQMDSWLFWEQYSHEPYIAVARFQVAYLGRPVDALDRNLFTRGYRALDHMERQLNATSFLVDDTLSLADIALLAYTRMAHEGGFDLSRYPALRRWIAVAEAELGLQPAA